MSAPPLLAVRDLRKRYQGVVALDGINLTVERGTVHAVVGENGAGKSTLMKVLAGVERADSGSISLDGNIIELGSPAAARERGVGIVYQELSLFPQRSVLANVFVNRELTRHGLVSTAEMHRRSRPLLDQLGLHVDVHAPVGRLSIGEQQLVEISRVLLEEPALLILDEPNSALNERETTRLFAVLRQLRSRGVTMLYVSHRLEEVFAIADRVTVARNGREVLTNTRAALTIREVIEAMVGRPDELFPPRLPPRTDLRPARVAVRGLSGGPLSNIDFSAAAGELVGVAGLEGSGVSSLLGILFGAQPARAAEASFPDGRGLPRSPTEAARRGICLVPADRRRHGLMLERSLLFNISHVVMGALRGTPWYDTRAAQQRAERQMQRLRIRASSPFSRASALSGGNQQKVVIAKWLESAPRVVLLDDPARGIDVGAKREIFALIREVSAEGRIVVFSSTELPELIGLCDRILVLYRGRVAGQLEGAAINEHALLHLMNTGESSPSAATSVAHPAGGLGPEQPRGKG